MNLSGSPEKTEGSRAGSLVRASNACTETSLLALTVHCHSSDVTVTSFISLFLLNTDSLTLFTCARGLTWSCFRISFRLSSYHLKISLIFQSFFQSLAFGQQIPPPFPFLPFLQQVVQHILTGGYKQNLGTEAPNIDWAYSSVICNLAFSALASKSSGPTSLIHTFNSTIVSLVAAEQKSNFLLTSVKV